MDSRLALAGVLTSLTVIFQSAGELLPVAGFFVSPLSTAPIALSALRSASDGILTYLSTTILLLFLVPGEVPVFALTTGLLGISLGTCLRYSLRQEASIIISALVLTCGVGFGLFALKLPLLGPAVKASSHWLWLLPFFILGIAYAWLWLLILSKLHSVIRALGSKQSKPE